MRDEVVAFLRPHPAGTYVDGTVGEGGHAEAILRASDPSGRLVGIDRDRGALAAARERLRSFGARVQLLHMESIEMQVSLHRLGITCVEGILLDLGMSSYQLANPARGFSFMREGPLDMRMDRSTEPTAATLLQTLGEGELAMLIQRYGEERWARRIARAIVRARRRAPIRTTLELAALVTQVIPASSRPPRIHPATRTFQALRIAVNRELETLEPTLRAALACLSEGGRLCVIAYHSLEDRIVKRTFRAAELSDTDPAFRVLTRKPVTPSIAERRENPRARSAKLRVLERAADLQGKKGESQREDRGLATPAR
jgi:16S rRNA (cytosine1402-N4)-methyltransferase